MVLVSGNQYRANQLDWLSSKQYDWLGITNALVKQPIAGQQIRLVVEQPMVLVSGNQYIG